MGINYKLKEARHRRGFSQERLAKAIGLSMFGYLRKENGTRNFTEKEIKKICEVLDYEITDIFFND